MATLMLVPLILHYLGSEKYGLWVSISALLQWFTFFDFGLGNGLRNKLTQCIADKDYPRAKIYVSSTYFSVSAIFLMLFITFMLFGHYIDWITLFNLPQNFNEDIRLLMNILFALFCLRFILQLIQPIFFAFQKPALRDLLGAIGIYLTLVLVWYVSKGHDNSIFKVGVIFGAVPLFVLSGATLIFFNRNKMLKPAIKDVSINYSKDVISLGSKFLILQLSAVLLITTTPIMINYFCGGKVTAEYNIAFKYFSIVQIASTIIFAPFWSAVTDALSNKNHNWIRKALKINLLISLLLLIVGILMVIASPFIFGFWVKGFNVSYNLTWWVFAFIGGLIVYQPLINFINGLGKPRQQMLIAIAIIALLIPSEILLFKIFKMGVESFIIPPVIVTIVRIIFGFFQLRKELRFGLKKGKPENSFSS